MRQCDSCENAKEFVMRSPHVMPHPIVSQIANANLKMNATVARCLQANETSRHVTTCHRHVT